MNCAVHVSREVVLVQEGIHALEVLARRVIDVIGQGVGIAELVQ